MSTKTTTPEEEKVTGLKLYENERKASKDNKLAYYQTQYDDLDASKKRQQEMASITLDKLQKYLPYQLKAQGLSNSGASESAMLQAHTNYMNTMSDIAANTNVEKIALERYKQQDIDAINEKYDLKAAEESAANYEIAANNVMTKLENYVQSSEDRKISQAQTDEITNYINGLTNVSENDRARLYMLLDNGFEVRSEEEETRINTENDKVKNVNLRTDAEVVKMSQAEKNGNGRNFKIYLTNDKGEKTMYKVERGIEAPTYTSEILTKKIESLNKELTAGQIVTYDNKIYLYVDDAWYLVNGRGGNLANGSSTDAKDWRNFTSALKISAYEDID